MNEKPILKVGIISDSQGYDYPEDWGSYNLEKAFEVLADKGIDVLLNAGDIGDHGDDRTPMDYYMKLFRQHFAGKEPVQVACLGNHDFWAHLPNRTQEDCLRDFYDAIGEEPQQVVHKVIGGYDFIALNSDNTHSYDAEDCAKLRPYLEKAAARDSSKPIFLVTHYHPKNTVEASFDGCGKPALREILNDFPQVVSFSGHSHSPLNDERCIWQGEFTAINTSGLSYGCIPERCANVCGPILPFGREALFFMYMEIFEDRLEIHRYNAEDKVEIKANMLWKIDLPYSPEKAIYTAARAAGRKAPEFDPGTKLIFRYDFGFCYCVFDQAKHDDFVHFYRMVMTELGPDGEEIKKMEARYVGNFYRIDRNRDNRLVLRIPPNTLEKAKRYRIEIFPVETFGKEGKPLSLVTTIRHSYTFNNLSEIGPQE